MVNTIHDTITHSTIRWLVENVLFIVYYDEQRFAFYVNSLALKIDYYNESWCLKANMSHIAGLQEQVRYLTEENKRLNQKLCLLVRRYNTDVTALNGEVNALNTKLYLSITENTRLSTELFKLIFTKQ